MNVERLLLAEKLLREVHLGTWKVTSKSALEANEPFKDFTGKSWFRLESWVDEATNDCGFSACAVGHMCLDQRFNDQGLVMDLDWGLEGAPEYVLRGCDENPHSWDAVQMFFDISEDQAKHLFNRHCYVNAPSAKRVADRIHNLVRKHQKG